MRLSRIAGSQRSPELVARERRREAEVATNVAGSVLFFGSALLVPWWLAVPDLSSQMLLFGSLVVCALGLGSSVAGGVAPIRLVWYTFHLAWIVVGATYQLGNQVFAWGDHALLSRGAELDYALLLMLGANLAFLVGGRTVGAVPSGRLSRSVAVRPNATWAYLGSCVLLAPYAIAVNGGISNLFSSRLERDQARYAAGISVAESGGAVVALGTILPAALATAALLLFLFQYLHFPETRCRRNRIGTAMSVGLILIFANPITSSRYLAMATLGSIAVILLGGKLKRHPVGLLVVLLVVVLFVYPLGSGFKGGANSLDLRWETSVFASPEFDGYQQIANTVVYVEQHGYQVGRQTLSAGLYFVPRSIWEAKANPASFAVAENRGYRFQNLSLPLFAELYLDFGPLLMLVAVFYLGRLVRRLDSSWLLGGAALGALLTPYIACAAFGMLRGPLGAQVPVALTVVGLLVLGVRRQRHSMVRPELKPSGVVSL